MPILGHGDIASVIPDRADLTFFASGVSNSSEQRESEYLREVTLLRKQDRKAHLVYFSSLCVFYGSNRYAQHKRQMEFIVADEFRLHTIVRLGATTWGTNPNLLINHLRFRRAAGLPLEVQDVYRVVHTLADFHYALSLIPTWSCELPVPGRLMKVADIVREYVGDLTYA
jgi:hypothetical protein